MIINSIVFDISKTETGFSAVTPNIENFIVASEAKGLNEFLDYIEESINFYIDCCKQDQEEIPECLQGNYIIHCNLKL